MYDFELERSRRSTIRLRRVGRTRIGATAPCRTGYWHPRRTRLPDRLTEYTIDADTAQSAVVGLTQLTALERSILPPDYEIIDPFTDETFDYPAVVSLTLRPRLSMQFSVLRGWRNASAASWQRTTLRRDRTRHDYGVSSVRTGPANRRCSTSSRGSTSPTRSVSVNGIDVTGRSPTRSPSRGSFRTFQTPRRPEGMTVREAILVGPHNQTGESIFPAVHIAEYRRTEERRTLEQARRCSNASRLAIWRPSPRRTSRAGS